MRKGVLPFGYIDQNAYSAEYPALVRSYALLGAKDSAIADIFGVSLDTFQSWRDEHPEFNRAIKFGRTHADAQVAKALYNRAIGYTKQTKIGRDDNGEPIYKETHYPPDVAACIYWLKSRRKKEEDGEMWLVKDDDVAKPKLEIDDVELARTVAFILTEAMEKKNRIDPPTIDVTPSNSK